MKKALILLLAPLVFAGCNGIPKTLPTLLDASAERTENQTAVVTALLDGYHANSTSASARLVHLANELRSIDTSNLDATAKEKFAASISALEGLARRLEVSETRARASKDTEMIFADIAETLRFTSSLLKEENEKEAKVRELLHKIKKSDAKTD